MHTELARARRHGIVISCLLMHLDGTEDARSVTRSKKSRRSDAAEALLRHLGDLVRDKTRGHDHVGVIDDTRYLLMLPHTGPDEAMVVAERIAKAFRDEVAIDEAGAGTGSGTLSVGVVFCDDPEVMFFETVMRRAQAALDRAVGAGGNRCVLYETLDVTNEGGSDGTREAPEA